MAKILKMFDGEVIKRFLRVTIFSKPMKNKFILIKLGDKAADFFPSDGDIEDVTTKMNEMAKGDEKNFSGTSFLVTHPYVRMNRYNIEKMRKSVTVFLVGGPSLPPTSDEVIEAFRQKIASVYDGLKIPHHKFLVLKHPVEIVMEKNIEENNS